jgi:chromosome segregation ATPase
MGLRDLLVKSGLCEEEPSDKVVKKPTKVEPVIASNNPSIGIPTIPQVDAVITPVVLTSDDAKYTEPLNAALKEASKGGFDIIKFAAAVEALSKIIPDEKTRYRTALATSAAATGTTLPEILATYSHFVEVLKSEENDFNVNYIGGLKSQIEAKNADIAKIESNISAIVEQINQLNEQLNTLSSDKSKAEGEVSDIQITIETETRNFGSALYKENARLSNTEANIHKYLEQEGQ